MEPMMAFKFLAVGALAGLASGIFGIGGGLVIVPLLVLCFGFSQHMAQGTSLAVLIFPFSLLAAFRYYQGGNVQFSAVFWIVLGASLTAWVGAHFVHHLSDTVLRRIFGLCFLAVSMKLIFGK